MPVFQFTEIKVDLYHGDVMKKPVIIIASTLFPSTGPLPAVHDSTKTPVWSRITLPNLPATTQCQEYIETCCILLIVRDTAQKKIESQHKGSAYIPLYGHVINQEDREHLFEIAFE